MLTLKQESLDFLMISLITLFLINMIIHHNFCPFHTCVNFIMIKTYSGNICSRLIKVLKSQKETVKWSENQWPSRLSVNMTLFRRLIDLHKWHNIESHLILKHKKMNESETQNDENLFNNMEFLAIWLFLTLFHLMNRTSWIMLFCVVDKVTLIRGLRYSHNNVFSSHYSSNTIISVLLHSSLFALIACTQSFLRSHWAPPSGRLY